MLLEIKDMTKFKQKYRNLDALLLDDIQFISENSMSRKKFSYFQ